MPSFARAFRPTFSMVLPLLFLLVIANDSQAGRGSSRRPKRIPGSSIMPMAQTPAVPDAPGQDISETEPDPFAPAVAQAAYGPAPGQAANTGTVVLNFTDAGLKDILRTVAEMTGENFIVAPGVTARITVQTAKPVPRKDVFGIFESVLEVNGLSAVKSGGYYKIVPANTAKQHALEVMDKDDLNGDGPAPDRFVNLVVPVDFISAADLAQMLKPALSPSGAVTAHAKSNTLIISDLASNVKGYSEIINALDVDAFQERETALIQIKNVDVKTLNKELSDILGALGFGKETPQLEVVPVERLNSLIVFTSSAELMESVKGWVERLDRPSSSQGSTIHTYYVRNDKASNIKNLLEQLFGGKKTSSSSLAVAAAQTQNYPAVPSSTSAVKYEAQTRPEAPTGDEIRIYIYEPANAIIFQSTERDYQNILNTIRELDRPPKQVLIDAVVAEVTLNESTRYGIQWSALTGQFNIQQNTGIVPSTIADPRAAIPSPIGLAAPTGLAAFATDAKRFFAAVQALASTGNVDVLSNPHVLVKNYEKAQINVGSDEPVATQSTQTAVTGTSGIIQNIEYRKTGVILTVVPQITEGGMVALNIKQEVSDKSTDRTIGNAVYPSFTKREAETSIVARDKETIVIGGLIQDRKDRSTTGIPLLSSIPVIGSLFRSTSRTNGKTELVILLTPTVVSSPEEAAGVTEEVKKRLGGLRGLLRPRQAQGGRELMK